MEKSDSNALNTRPLKKHRERDTTGKWTFYGTSSITTNQSQFSNWQMGGINSIAISTALNLNLGFTNKTINWQTTLDVGYGLSLQGTTTKWFKNDDRFSISTKLGKQARKGWYYTILASCSTQFQPGYYTIDDPTFSSNFWAPGIVITSIGIDYNPSQKLSVFIGPVTSKNTFVSDQRLANMGVGGIPPAEMDYYTGVITKPAKKFMSETGGYMRIQFTEPRVMKNISIQSVIELFNNYLRNPDRIDVNIQNMINIKINEYISTNLMINLKYDDDVKIVTPTGTGPRIQFMEVLGVGLAINLGRM